VVVGDGLVEVGDGRCSGAEGDEQVGDDVVLRRGVGALGEIGREGKGDGGEKVGAELAFELAQAAPHATEEAAGESACDPLTPKPITLGTIIGVGQDAAGTLYVDSANGIFVSGNVELSRQYVNGTGQSGSTEFIFTFESPGSDASSARTLLVETQGSTASAMALGPAGSRAFLGQSDAGVTSLTLVDPATGERRSLADPIVPAGELR
jgi:hypothetical protein